MYSVQYMNLTVFVYLTNRLLQTAIKANAYGDEIKNLEKAILEAENANTVSITVQYV